MITVRIMLLAAAIGTAATAAEAGIPVSQQVTCPIGGAAFSFTTTASYSTWGARPDGKPFGSWQFPLAIPDCPDNGLVIYAEFNEDELRRLRPLVLSDEYQQLRGRGDTSYYRAAWLMERMGAPAPNWLWMLVQASWQAEPDPALRRRYLEELVERSPVLGEPRSVEILALRSRVINALRELGRFGEAAAMIAATSFDSLPLEGVPPSDRDDWRGHYRRLGIIIARGDPSIEPIDMIPRRVAGYRCAEAASLDSGQRALCREWDPAWAPEPQPPAS